MIKNPIFYFKTLNDTGIDLVPNNSVIIIEDADGHIFNLMKIADGNLDQNSTISDFITDNTTWKTMDPGYGIIQTEPFSVHTGKWNIGNTGTIHETGIGTADNDRKNAFEIYTDGRVRAPELTNILVDNGDDFMVTTKGSAVTSFENDDATEKRINCMVECTQAYYDSLNPPEEHKLYVIVG